jgi:hypothetical protein
LLICFWAGKKNALPAIWAALMFCYVLEWAVHFCLVSVLIRGPKSPGQPETPNSSHGVPSSLSGVRHLSASKTHCIQYYQKRSSCICLQTALLLHQITPLFTTTFLPISAPTLSYPQKSHRIRRRLSPTVPAASPCRAPRDAVVLDVPSRASSR